LEKEGEHSIAVKIETWSASREEAKAEKVTEGIFTYVALDDTGKPRTLAN
jgi:acyl-CoA thioesterase YciA